MEIDAHERGVQHVVYVNPCKQCAAQQSVQQTVRYCPNCRVKLVNDKCGKCGVQWTLHSR